MHVDQLRDMLGNPRRSVAITPSDTNTDLAYVLRALWVGTGGDVAVVMELDTAPHVIPDVPSGSYLMGNIRQVRLTGTTASGLVGYA